MANVIDIFNTCNSVNVASAGKVLLPNNTGSVHVKHNDKHYFIGFCSVDEEKISPVIYITEFDNDFNSYRALATGNGCTQKGMERDLGWTFDKKGTFLEVNNGAEIVQISQHFRFCSQILAFSVSLPEDKTFPEQVKGATKPFDKCQVMVIGAEYESMQKAGFFENPLSENQTGSLLRNTIWSGKSEHGIYNTKLSSGVRKGKYPYYLAFVYPHISETMNAS